MRTSDQPKMHGNGSKGLDMKHELNLSFKKLGSWLLRSSTVVLIFIVVLALAGKWARKTRHVFEGFVKGLNLVVTSVMCFVIMSTPYPSTSRGGTGSSYFDFNAHTIDHRSLKVVKGVTFLQDPITLTLLVCMVGRSIGLYSVAIWSPFTLLHPDQLPQLGHDHTTTECHNSFRVFEADPAANHSPLQISLSACCEPFES